MKNLLHDIDFINHVPEVSVIFVDDNDVSNYLLYTILYMSSCNTLSQQIFIHFWLFGQNTCISML